MTLREPLVIVNGQIQQLPSGDTVNGTVPTAATNYFAATNNQGSTINICTAVYVDVADSVKLASANSATLSVFAGLVKANIGTGNTGNIQFGDIFTATTGQWDAVTGATGGLVAGTLYFLSPTASGNLTVTAPTTVNQYVVPVGRAINTTNMNIFQRSTILL
jgi:hypothetical protein